MQELKKCCFRLTITCQTTGHANSHMYFISTAHTDIYTLTVLKIARIKGNKAMWQYKSEVKLLAWTEAQAVFLTDIEWLSEVCACVCLCHLLPWYQQSVCRDWKACCCTDTFICLLSSAGRGAQTRGVSYRNDLSLLNDRVSAVTCHLAHTFHPVWLFRALITCPDSPLSRVARHLTFQHEVEFILQIIQVGSHPHAAVLLVSWLEFASVSMWQHIHLFKCAFKPLSSVNNGWSYKMLRSHGTVVNLLPKLGFYFCLFT